MKSTQFCVCVRVCVCLVRHGCCFCFTVLRNSLAFLRPDNINLGNHGAAISITSHDTTILAKKNVILSLYERQQEVLTLPETV